jgi:carboxypeptidase T
VADAPAYQALAEELGDALDWPAGPWTEVYYDASGVAEEHAYYTAGLFAFTTEATPGHSGLARFHPPYSYVVDQYWGTGHYEGSSIREAFLLAWEAAADPARHALLTGTAPPGTELVITKDVTVHSSCPLHPLFGVVRPEAMNSCPLGALGDLQLVVTSPVRIRSTMTVPADGRFTWHVLPSLRPSQYQTAHLVESWTVSCTDAGGAVARAVEVTIGRGQDQELDLSACPAGG